MEGTSYRSIRRAVCRQGHTGTAMVHGRLLVQAMVLRRLLVQPVEVGFAIGSTGLCQCSGSAKALLGGGTRVMGHWACITTGVSVRV